MDRTDIPRQDNTPNQASEQFDDSSDGTVVLEPLSQHTRTAIMLHGRGSSATEFSGELFETHCSSGESLRELLPGWRWVFPCAPRSLCARFKETMHQWYDFYSLDDTEEQLEGQIEGIRSSVNLVRGVIAREAEESPTGDVVLGGISQGFSIALVTLLTGTADINAVVGFSSWLPLRSLVEDCIAEGQSRPEDGQDHQHVAVSEALSSKLGVSASDPGKIRLPPVFLGHCADDELVDVEHGRAIRDTLQKLEYAVDWRESPYGGHWINEPHGMNGLKSFLWVNDLVNTRS